MLPECDALGSASFSDPDPEVFFRNPDRPDYCEKPSIDLSANGSSSANISSCSLLRLRDVVGYEACDVRRGDEVVYAEFEYESTFVTELNLVRVKQESDAGHGSSNDLSL